MRREPLGGFLVPIFLVAAGVLAMFWFATEAQPPRTLGPDERAELTAASNLARHRVFSSAAPAAGAPAPDAQRAPLYAAALALSWQFTPIAPPSSDAEIESYASPGMRRRSLRRLQVLLLFAAAAAAGALVARLGDGTAGGLAFLLVATSPALQAHARFAAAENLAALLLIIGTFALVAAIEGGALVAGLAGLVLGALPLAVTSGTLVVVAGALVVGLAGSARPGRLARLALFLALASLPSLAWQQRNFVQLGRFELVEHAGGGPARRAALDREIERHGAVTAALAWTPLDAARRAAQRRAPEASFDPPPRSAERAGLFARLASVAALSWRALFVERSPGWASPFDLRLILGLLLAAGLAGVAVPGVKGPDGRLIALLAPAAALFAYNALFTDFPERAALPLLPVAWSALALVAAGGVDPQPQVSPRQKRA